MRTDTDRLLKEGIPPLNSLRAFEVAARHGSFRTAASTLYVSPTAVTRHVKLLEEFLDAGLFKRRCNGVDLTPEGRRYAEKVTKILIDLASATIEVRRPEKWNRLVVSSLVVFAQRWLRRRLSAFENGRRHTSVQVELHDGLHGILTGEADAWILYSDGDHPGCDVTKLFGEQLVPVCSPALRETLPARPGAEDVVRLPLLHDISWSGDWPLWADAMGLAAADVLGGARFVLYDELIRAAVNGEGVAMGHTAMIGAELESGRLAAFDGMGFASPSAFHLVMTRARENSRLAGEFRDWLKAECDGR